MKAKTIVITGVMIFIAVVTCLKIMSLRSGSDEGSSPASAAVREAAGTNGTDTVTEDNRSAKIILQPDRPEEPSPPAYMEAASIPHTNSVSFHQLTDAELLHWQYGMLSSVNSAAGGGSARTAAPVVTLMLPDAAAESSDPNAGIYDWFLSILQTDADSQGIRHIVNEWIDLWTDKADPQPGVLVSIRF
jgi:hypothetical protein